MNTAPIVSAANISGAPLINVDTPSIVIKLESFNDFSSPIIFAPIKYVPLYINGAVKGLGICTPKAAAILLHFNKEAMKTATAI